MTKEKKVINILKVINNAVATEGKQRKTLCHVNNPMRVLITC